MASSALAKRSDTLKMVREDLGRNLRSLAAAFPPSVGGGATSLLAARAARVAMTQITANPKLLDCTRQSLIGSVIQACQLGLELDGVMGQAYLVPYLQYDKASKSKFLVCQMQVGFRGFTTLAVRSGLIYGVFPTLVYANERYKVTGGDNPKIEHERIMDDDARGELRGVYATARFKSGFNFHHAMTLGEVHKRRDASKAKDAGPWRDWYPEMVQKTAVRGCCRNLTLCAEAQRAALHDEYVEAGHAPQQPTFDDLTVEADCSVVDVGTPEDFGPGKAEPGANG